jgi:hypothetical protein
MSSVYCPGYTCQPVAYVGVYSFLAGKNLLSQYVAVFDTIKKLIFLIFKNP